MTQVYEDVKKRKHFYRDQYRRYLMALVICLIIIILLLLGIGFTYFTRGQSSYYATSNDGKLWQINTATWGSRLPEPKQVIELQQQQQQQTIDTTTNDNNNNNETGE